MCSPRTTGRRSLRCKELWRLVTDAVDPPPRAIILAALADPPEGLAELRGVVTNEHERGN